ncbi:MULTISPECIES: hypothetical protein [Rhodococcus]|uniref:hypothetical protein n=1 Tax=Rhodococcus TaxID=1827 RepID=UPI001E526C64|nr:MULTISPECIES: hypothetical protein [Rhodococcus]MCD2106275.1 hypothetical protein [Rhodococcus qingshengii]MCZ4524701.1 hypothetical protein [Rhodococcus erythropolis]MDV8009421.1 hypothetical protein [Rhodococcus sp. IEGM 1318]MDZ7914575.1 hypothetical protein [Rhodococcus sp. (in: high G+C Gram-positive bacteria)]
MRTIRFRAALAVVAAGVLTLGAVSTATAAPLPNAPFGGWGKCPIANPETSTCVDVVVKGGEMNINGLKVPIPSGSLNIAGGVAYRENPDAEFGFDQIFIPPTDGTKGVYSTPIEVPGGIFGLGLPFPGGLTTIKATVEPVALPTVDAFQLGVTLPARLKISNPLLGGNCYLGSASNPILFKLGVSENGVLEEVPGFPDTAAVRNVTHADQSFAVPGASGCGLFGALNWAVNLRANVPSSSGHNSLTTTSDVFNIGADSLRTQ